MFSKYDAAIKRGLVDFDCALPLAWVHECREAGVEVVPHFVWSYDNHMFGTPAAITGTGDDLRISFPHLF